MSEYIKREDAINKLADEYVFDARSEYEGTFTRADFIDDAKETLADIPSADVVEVVHAYDKNIYPSLFECSNCGWSCDDTYGGEPCNRNSNTYDYCPNCGARIEYKVKE